MASIEERIVQMQFDNTAFERKMSTTLQSLEKMNTTLANVGNRNGLQNIAQSVKGMNFGPLSASIDGISAKFLALSTVAITALSNIVNRAVDAGIRIAKAFTLDPLTQGFEEYETQIGSIQTILANTQREGTNLREVNAALDELNEYSDRTIYNFSEMARNIGTFTAAGVDLDTSVTSIQGIANLAAISGSNSQQASTAMYQLSQAISSGTVRLMDWNSVVNAGMGGEVFQRALFDTGVAMGTIADAPMGTTFDEWTAAGNTFRGSLEQGWLTAEVLTTTLGAFSGEMTEAQLTAIGFTQEQAAEMIKLGQTGVDAATKIRTMSQLMTTIKESLSSGWAQSFRIIFGDFEEATALFTRVGESVGGFISRNAEARNALLQTWKDMGGRTKLLYAFGSGFKSLRIAMQPISRAFREVFPPLTANRLVDLTESFGKLMVAIRPGTQTIVNMGKIFKGLFSILSIGWTVIKEGIGFIAGLFKSLTGAGSGGFLTFLGKIGQGISDLRETLVEGGGIAEFFDGLNLSLQGPLTAIQNFRTKLLGIFTNLEVPKGLKDFFKKIGDAFGGLGGLTGNVGDIWAPLRNAGEAVGGILEGIWESIKGFFSGLGDRISGVFGGDAFAGVLDTIDTGLLGGIAVLLAKFLGGGINLDFGGGLFGNISQSFEELTGVLSAMQTNLKANALLKIAGAIGILAVSLTLLASVDPDKMSNALAALAIGFGQLLGAFAIMNNMGIGPRAAATMNLIATAMIGMAAAVLILSAAVKIFSTMSWEELAKGLVGVAGALGLLVGASILLSKFSGSMIRAGVGMMAMAVALGIMAGVVKLFSMLDWDEMLKGLAGVAGTLVAVAIGMRLMPKGMLLQGAGLLLIAASLNGLYFAVKNFSSLNWEQMGKGLVGVAGTLIAIGVAVRLMPATLPLIGAGLVLVSGSLMILAEVMQTIAGMSWEGIAKGLVGMAGALAAITLAMAAASGSALGAVSITIMAFAIGMLFDTLQDVAKMDWGDLIKGFVAIAGALAILGVASLLLAPVIPAMLGLGLALTLVGAAVALAGVGILAIAKGFELLARVGTEGVAVLIRALTDFAKSLPDVLRGVAEGVLELVKTVLEGLPEIIGHLGEIIAAILDVIIENIPAAGEAIRALITELLETVRETFPDFVTTGFDMLLSFLKGIRDNIEEIVVVVSEIITKFLDALTAKLPDIIDSVYNFFVALVKGVVEKLVDVGKDLLPIGTKLIEGVVKGLSDALPKIGDFFKALPGKVLGFLVDVGSWLLEKGGQLLSGLWNGASAFITETLIPGIASLPSNIITWIGDTLSTLLTKGGNLIQGLWDGIWEKMNTVVIPWLEGLPGSILNWIGSLLNTLLLRGKTLIQGLWNGIKEKMDTVVIPWLKALPGNILNWIGSLLNTLKLRGLSLIQGLWNGIWEKMDTVVIPWLKGLPQKVIDWIGDVGETLKTKGINFIVGLINGYIGKINEDVIPFFQALGSKVITWIGDVSGTLYNIGKSIIQGLWNGMQDLWDDVTGWLGGLASDIVDWKGPPEKDAVLLTPVGHLIFEGLQKGMSDEWDLVGRWLRGIDPSDELDSRLAAKMNRVIDELAWQLESMEEFHPVITPVLDLSLIRQGAMEMAAIFNTGPAYQAASRIASTALLDRDPSTSPDGAVSEIKFEQNNYSPSQLSTGDIYRKTRNQLAMAKEELGIS